MGKKKDLIDRLFGTREDRDAYRQAQAELAEAGAADRRAGLTEESDEFLAANERVAEAANRLPLHRSRH